ncbi:vWA domain-containing protein [Microbacterium sp. No. 7]|uniref:vWA domain-containing protein n=1 Tax=Microbacterium sp. No. 7 TaxID=1714373 RepID=UPI0006D19655|nr:VWA domain-containing protein [Microbacterium sp. No. 7]ALJ21532.1 hypothetical protein AOA12_17200 [Microbacterium sp. No. 7]
MALAQGWALVAVLGALVLTLLVGAAIGLWTSRARRGGAAAAVARAERVRALPAFQRTVRRRIVALTAVLALGAGAVIVTGVLVARPQSVRTVDPVASHRDIVLCLDVSGSMAEVNHDLLTMFAGLAAEFRGERVGLTIFDGSAVQVFPLTSDSAYVQRQLGDLAAAGNSREMHAGTHLGPSSSLIGDGLAACVLHFDQPDLDRSRSVILATDNYSGDGTIVTLEEAAAYAADHGVRVYAINPDASYGDPAYQLVAAAQSTGGRGYDLAASDTIDKVVADVRREAIAELRGKPQAVETDAPGPWIVAAVLAAGAFLVVMERVRL